MDKTTSLELERELKGTILGGFKVLELINNGKSAAVFKAEKGEKLFALKIFDNKLIERFGHEIQTKRIEQEIALKNHTIENLVKIYEGGNASVGAQTYYFIVMELIIGMNLKDYIAQKNYEQSFILNVLDTLINTTEQLLTNKQIAHRDIKPENIMVSQDGKITLMDLGVLKLIGAKSFSDEEEKSFVGTLRYAPPEFLLRTEDDSIFGWRAINIYQIGATLHDLVMKRELFIDKTPYSNLVIAIKDDTPKISGSFAFDLLQLTRDMMTKDWKKRLELITNDRLTKAVLIQENIGNSFEEGIEEVLKMRMGHQAKFDEIEKLQRTKEELRKKQKEIGISLAREIDKCFENIKNKGVYTAFNKSGHFYFDDDRSRIDVMTQNYLYELQGELKMGFPRSLYVLVRMRNDEANYTEVELLGIFPSTSFKSNTERPSNFFQEISNERQRFPNKNTNGEIKTVNIFEGIVDFDESFNQHLGTQIVKLITKALKAVEKNVQEEMQWREDLVKSKKSIHIRTTTGNGSVIINTL